jgi:hypothetical protein
MVLEAGMEMGVVGVEVEVEVAMDLQVETGMGREVVLEVLMGQEVGWVDSATLVCWKK